MIGILLSVQAAEERKYISRPAAAYIAQKLNLRITQLYDVISFYSALYDTPRAKYPLEVCNSAPCRVNDSDTLLETLKDILGIDLDEVTYDGRFTIQKVPCFGACDQAPPCGSTAWCTDILPTGSGFSPCSASWIKGVAHHGKHSFFHLPPLREVRSLEHQGL